MSLIFFSLGEQVKRAVMAGCYFALTACHRPSDQVLRATFSAKQQAFQEVAAEVDAERLRGYITPSQQRALLDKLQSPLKREPFRLAHRDDGTVLFGYSAYGLSVAGSRKGIARVPPKSLRFYEVLDPDSPWPRKEGEFLKPIQADWYVYEIDT